MTGLDGLLEGLNDAQRDAVTSEAAPLCILAGAGTGKTRVLTRRIAHRCAKGGADPRHVLALTFTRKAAGELTQRLRALGLRDRVSAGTFHGVAYGQLRTHWADRAMRPPTLLDRKGRLLGRLLPRSPGKPFTALDAASEIEWAKARMVTPSHYAEAAAGAGRRPPLPPDAMAAVYERYEEERRRRRLVDFDDLLWLCARAMATDDDFRAAQRWQFRHLFVDEFQDVNPLQFRLLRTWQGDHLDLCVVGDPNQAIYAWNGADAGYLTRFHDHFPGAGVVALERNYRSSPQVLALANAVLDGGGPRGLRLHATRADGPIPSVHSFATDRHEARGIARAVRDRNRPGVPWSHQAVLVRTNAQGVLLEEALRAAGIPFRLRGRAAFLDLPEIEDALRTLTGSGTSLARGLAQVEAAVDAGGPAGRRPGGDGDGGGDGDVVGDRDDRGDGDREGDVDGDGSGAGTARSEAESARVANLAELLRLAEEYSGTDPDPTGAGFATWLAATVRAEDAGSGGDAVEIATFHAAKGLEWPIVHVAGLEAGLVPIGHAKTAGAEAEERRLLYVAVTRAERELRLSWAEQRSFGTRTSSRSPSPYLADVEPVLAAMAAGVAPADWRPQLARQRERLAGRRGGPGRASAPGGGALTEPGDVALLEDLKRWRSTAARAADVPAFVIFHDSTLQELARARPASRQALLGVAGIGKVKAGRFGDDVLAVLSRHSAGPS